MMNTEVLDSNSDTSELDAGLPSKFCWQWMELPDHHGVIYSDYLQKINQPGYVQCKWCNCKFSYGTSGVGALEEHAKSKEHTGKFKLNMLFMDQSVCDSQMTALCREIDTGLIHKFRGEWMITKDSNEVCYGLYLSKMNKPGYMYCSWCETELNYGLGGFTSLKVHVKSNKHMAYFHFYRSHPSQLPERGGANKLISNSTFKQPSIDLVDPALAEAEISYTIARYRAIDASVSTTFQWEWITMKDPDMVCYGVYLYKMNKPGYAYCTWCESELHYGKRGFRTLREHVRSNKHTAKVTLFKNQFSEFPRRCGENKSVHSSTHDQPEIKLFDLALDKDDTANTVARHREIDASPPNKFRGEWMAMEDSNKVCYGIYLRKMNKPGFMCCTWCETELNYGISGFSTFKDHVKSNKHTEKFQFYRRSQPSQFPGESETSALGPNSSPSQSRMKLLDPVEDKQEISTLIHTKLLDDLWKYKFSVSLDQTASKRGCTTVSYHVSYYSEVEKQCVVKHYMSAVIDNLNIVNLSRIFLERLQRDRIPRENVIGVLPNRTAGKVTGFAVELKKHIPHLLDIDFNMNMSGHVGNLATMFRAAFDGQVENLIAGLHADISSDKDIKEALMQICDLLNIEFCTPQEICESKWLSVLEAVQLHYNMFNALVVLYWTWTYDRDKKLSQFVYDDITSELSRENKTKLAMLHEKLKNKDPLSPQNPRRQQIINRVISQRNYTLLVMELYIDMLPKFCSFISVYGQPGYRLYTELLQKVREFLGLFMKPQFTRDKPLGYLKKLKVKDVRFQLPDDGLYCGVKAERRVEILIKHSFTVKEFLRRARMAFVMAGEYLLKTFTLDDPVLKALSYIDPQAVTSDDACAALIHLCTLLPTVVTEDDSTGLSQEHAALHSMQLPKLQLDNNGDSVTRSVVAWWTELGETRKIPKMWSVVKACLSFWPGPELELVMPQYDSNTAADDASHMDITVDNYLQSKDKKILTLGDIKTLQDYELSLCKGSCKKCKIIEEIMEDTTDSYPRRKTDIELSELLHSDLLADLRKCKFTFTVDQTVPSPGKSIMSFLVLYYSEYEKQCVIRHYCSFLITNRSVQTVCEALMEQLEKDEIPSENIVSVLSGSPKIAFLSEISSKLKKYIPHLMDINTNMSQYVNDLVLAFRSAFDRKVENLLEDLQQDMSSHSHMEESLRVVCRLLNINFSMPKAISGDEWLADFEAFRSIYETFNALIVIYWTWVKSKDRKDYQFVYDNITAGLSAGDKAQLVGVHRSLRLLYSEMKQRIFEKVIFQRHYIVLVMELYIDMVPKFSSFNVVSVQNGFRSQNEMVQRAIGFLKLFIKPEALIDVSCLNRLDLNDLSVQLPNVDLFLGVKAAMHLRSLPSATLTRKQFINNTRDAFTAAGNYLLAHFPLNDRILKALSAVDPLAMWKHGTLEALKNLSPLATTMLNNEELTAFNYECDVLCITRLPKRPELSLKVTGKDLWRDWRVEEWWGKLAQTGKFPNLWTVVKACLSISPCPSIEEVTSKQLAIVMSDEDVPDIQVYSSDLTTKYYLWSKNKDKFTPKDMEDLQTKGVISATGSCPECVSADNRDKNRKRLLKLQSAKQMQKKRKHIQCKDTPIETGFYTCQYCFVKFKSEQDLNLHLFTEVHTGVDFTSCETCVCGFASNDQLESHLVTHTLPNI